MKIAIPKEIREGETRVAASPDTVKKFVALGAEVVVEAGAGIKAAVTDAAYEGAGATIATDAASALSGAEIVLKVQRPMLAGEGTDELGMIDRGALLVANLAPYDTPDALQAYADAGITACAMELIPRITRAQSMDVLSSQSNLAGYKAVLDACAVYGKAMPMMMTAAGTVPPAKCFIMGAGVAGLQAIATARRLGGVVSATDVRPAVKEQVESLGASFVAVEDDEFREAETAGGYAKQMSEAYQKKQAELVADHIAKQDIVICTALIPGRPAPTLITQDMVESMKPGSVIVDLAVERGGNCALSKPGEIVDHNGVLIVGHLNVPGRLPADASALYARNLLNFLTPLIDKETGALAIDWDDEIVKGVVLTRDGAIVHPAFAPASSEPAPEPEPEAGTAAGGDSDQQTSS
ncbi:MAG: Re/Si-specific NAD(P)(+) transhydrogenase subunit alpha [Pseudomonadota bacterium]